MASPLSDTDLSLALNTSFPKPSTNRKDERSSPFPLKFDHQLPSLSLAPLADQSSASAGSSSQKPTHDHSDDDEEEEEEASPRKKLRLTKDQAAVLELSFKHHSTLNPSQKQTLARQLSLRPRQVEVWFQNRRARTKLKQTEMESEKLKKNCKALTEENKRLNRELQELKALKLAASGAYEQTPSPAFSMCPSCGRFSGAGSPASDDHRYTVSAASTPSFYNMNGAKTPQLFAHSSAAC